jgi:4-hydroxybenzoate polyprenyltransferase
MSSRELIVRYLRERARLSVLVPLAIVMAAVGRWTGGWTGGPVDRWTGTTDYALAALTALVLILAFRVWDDIEDRARDAREHPGRVTVVADSVAPLIAFALVPGAIGALLVGLGPHAGSRLTAVGMAIAILAAWYRARLASARAVVNAHVVLLKYPLLVFAASPTSPSPGALVALYLVLCVYETVDDPSLRASIAARWIAISECALVSAIVATATLFGGRIP